MKKIITLSVTFILISSCPALEKDELLEMLRKKQRVDGRSILEQFEFELGK